MNKRSIEIKVRLNRKEAEMLDRRVKKSGLSREGYLRHLIGGFVPREAPPTDYFAMPNGFPGEMPDGFDPTNIQGGAGGDFPGQSSVDENGTAESNSANPGGRPSGGDMQMPDGDFSFDRNENQTPASDTTPWIWLAASVAILAIGLIVAKKYKV